MKIVFVIYHDVLEDRIDKIFELHAIDYYTEWEEVKGKGHQSDAHLGTRIFPGYNNVRMIAIEEDSVLQKLIDGITELNNEAIRPDDKIRLFQMPLERIV
jgi:hypothetical protein